MAIANKFIHFNTKAGFLNKLSEYVTYNESANTYTVKEGKQTDWNMFKNYTCFIKDTSEIWTHEQFYGTKEGMPNFSISYSSSSGDYILNLSEVIIKNNTNGICIVSCDPYSILPDISNVLGTYKINDSNLIINAPGDKDGSWYVFTIPVSGLIGNTYLDTYQYFYYTDPVYTKTYSPTEPSDSNPKPLGLNSAVGTSLKYAREDHVHMAPATISGNAGSATKLQTARTISLTGDAIGSASFDGSKDISITVGVNNDSHNHSDGSISSLNASKLTGTIAAERLPEIPIEKIPAAALERLFVVASEAAAMSASVQEGDVVQVTGNNNKMYFCISETATTFANKFKEFTAGTAASVPWSGITSKPSWIGTNKPTYNGSEINLANYTKATSDNPITSSNTINQAIGILDKRSEMGVAGVTDESGISYGNRALSTEIELNNGDVYQVFESKGVIDTYSNNLVPVDMKNERVIESFDCIVVYTVDGELQSGPGFTENEKKFLNGAGQFTTPPDTKDYPTSLTWTNGTTAGPIGKLTGTGMSTVNFPAIPSASESISGIITTGAQTFAGNKTFNGTINANIIKSTNSHSWMTACNYGNGVINMNQTTEGLNSAVVFQTNTDNHFTLSATNNYLMLGGYKGDERTFASNTINGHDGGIGIIIDDNSAVTDFNSVYQAKWRFYGYNGNPQGNIKWSIDQDGQFTGTSKYTKNYALTHKTVSSTSTIEAGNSYYIPTEVGFTISTLSGFSESTPDAQIVTGAKITFTASNAMKIQGLADITGNWFIYNLTYMPNGKVAISGAGFTN